MLKEWKRIRQEKHSFRRLFTDDNFDLYVWYKSPHNLTITGFQLVYNSDGCQKALTWQQESGFSHLKIDEGDKGLNRSPILVLDGLFDYGSVVDALRCSMKDLDPDISDLVIEKINKYTKTHPVL